MADATWKGEIATHFGYDSEGAARGISWCNLCGSDSPQGVVVRMPGNGDIGTAFFCPVCVVKLYKTLLYQTSPAKA